jgi:hypothetical protein
MKRMQVKCAAHPRAPALVQSHIKGIANEPSIKGFDGDSMIYAVVTLQNIPLKGTPDYVSIQI